MNPLQTLLFSAAATKTSLLHYILNILQKKRKRKGVLYAYYETDQVVRPLMKTMPGTSLHSLNIYDKKSFLRRKNSQEHLNFNNLITNPFIGLHTNAQTFRKRFAEYLYINHARFLERHSFSSVVATDEFSMPHSTLVKAANELKMWTFGLQHGQIYTNDSFYEKKDSGYIEYKRRTEKNNLVDYVIVYSEHEKNYLMDQSQYLTAVALGCPRYDTLAEAISEKRRRKILEQLGFSPQKKTVMWATQTHHNQELSPGENEKNCAILFPFFAQHKEQYNFIIKLHPNENQKAPLYKAWNKKYGEIAHILGKKTNTTEIIKAADAVLVKHSAVGSEAILVGTPVLFLDLMNNSQISMYTEEGFDMSIHSKEELEKNMGKVFTEQEQKRFAQNRKLYIQKRYENFGRASIAVTGFILNHLQKKK